MSSAAEAEIGALFINAKEAVPIRTSLTEMGHPQPPTPIETDNATAHGIICSTIRQKLSKAFDMRWHWLRDRVRQRQFRVFWRPGKQNLADYFTKHHPTWYHRKIRKKFLLHTHTDHEFPHLYWKRMCQNKMTQYANNQSRIKIDQRKLSKQTSAIPTSIKNLQVAQKIKK